MCLAIPMQIEEVTPNGMAHCRVGEGSTRITASTALLSEDVVAGDYIIVHAGFALRKMETKDAEETLRLLREIAEIAEEMHPQSRHV